MSTEKLVAEREKRAIARRKKKSSTPSIRSLALVSSKKLKKKLVKKTITIFRAKKPIKKAVPVKKKLSVKQVKKVPVKQVKKVPVKQVKKVPVKKKLSVKQVKVALPVRKKVVIAAPKIKQHEPVVLAKVHGEAKVLLRIPSKRRRLVASDVVNPKVSYVTCLNCGRVHFQRSRFEAKEEIANFNEFFEKAPPATRELFGDKPASIETYEKCFGCHQSYRYFRETEEGDAPDGVTLTPILDRFQ